MGPQLREVWEKQAPALLMPAGPWDSLPANTLLEIGSGSGECAVAAASGFDLVIAADVHLRGLAATIRAARAAGVDNLRLLQGDAVAALAEQVPPAALAEVHIWFPDPWPKHRHHKRRLIQAAFVELLAGRLRPGGVLRLATDAPEYAAQARQVLAADGRFAALGGGGLVPRPTWRPVSYYERRGLAQGRPPIDLAYLRAPNERNSSSAAASSHSTTD